MSDAASALEIARALIRFPSVTPDDAGALPWLAAQLGASGFATELVTFSAPGQPDILNLWARYGATGRNFLFAGHTTSCRSAIPRNGAICRSRARWSTASSTAAAPAT